MGKLIRENIEKPEWYERWESLSRDERIRAMEESKEKYIKLIPTMVDYFKLKFGENLSSIKVSKKGVHYGNELYSMEIPNLIFTFKEKPETILRREINDDLERFFNIPMKYYGIPFDFEIYYNKKPSLKESISPNIKRRGDLLFKISRKTNAYIHPCDYPREEYVDAVLNNLHHDLFFHSQDVKELEGEDMSDIRDFIDKFYSEHFLYHWDNICGNNMISESTQHKVMDRGLTKFFDNNFIKTIYPMVNKIEVYRIDDMDRLIVRIYVSDPEITKDNMYRKGLDPHYLIDKHMTKFFPYLDVPKDKKVGFVIMGPNDKVIDGFLP